MTALRQDAWTEEDDMLLAEVTLRHIREGSTQLAAFEEVAEKLGRTPAACGFRWNSCVRKNYEAAIQIAKAQRQGLKKRRRQPVQLKSDLDKQSDSVASLSTVIRFLRQHKQDYAQIGKQVRQLEKQLAEREAELERLRAEHEQLKRHVDTAQADYESINEDYKALIKIIDRARKLALLDEEEDEEKPTFKMDVNGNLERIDK